MGKKHKHEKHHRYKSDDERETPVLIPKLIVKFGSDNTPERSLSPAAPSLSLEESAGHHSHHHRHKEKKKKKKKDKKKEVVTSTERSEPLTTKKLTTWFPTRKTTTSNYFSRPLDYQRPVRPQTQLTNKVSPATLGRNIMSCLEVFES